MKTGSKVSVGRGNAVKDTVFADLEDNTWFVYKDITHESRVRLKIDSDCYLRIEDGKAKFYDIDAKGALKSHEPVVAVDVSINWAYSDDR